MIGQKRSYISVGKNEVTEAIRKIILDCNPGAELVSSGEFTVDKEAMDKAMGKERKKILIHRLSLIWNLIQVPALIIGGASLVAGWIKFGIYMTRTWADPFDAAVIFIVGCPSVALLLAVLVYGWWDDCGGRNAWNQLKINWNP